MTYNLRVLFASMWRQGVRSRYRRAYWKFLWLMAWNWYRQTAKMWLGFMVLLSAHHFVIYARQVADELENECQAAQSAQPSPSQEADACVANAGGAS